MSPDNENGIQHLLLKARAGAVTPVEFCRELYALGVKGQVARMRYIRDAFGLTSAKAKEIVVVADHGSVTAFAQEIMDSDK